MPVKSTQIINTTRFFRIAQSSYIYCGVTHFIALFSLWYSGIFELAIFSVLVSIPAFTAAYFLNAAGRPNIAFCLAFFELYSFQTYGIHLLGWNFGLQYFLLFLAMLSFFNPYIPRKYRLALLSTIIITYGHLYLSSISTPVHKYQFSPVIYKISYLISCTSFIILSAFLITYYRVASNKFEERLERLVAKRTKELEASRRSAIFMLGQAGHYNDTDTGEHIWRMAAYAAALAKAYGMSKRKIKLLELAAAMHDTGKIATPDSILKKPGKLTAAEWEIMKEHSEAGYNILSNSDARIFATAATIARYHHERWDGTGYPHGLKKKEIPESARIVAIADVFDALTMQRPYKEAWTSEKAFKEIANSSGSQFDPELAALFIEIREQIEDIRLQWEEKTFSQRITQI